ncbi:hypothetical protein AAZX31_02G143100 [Glycine max]
MRQIQMLSSFSPWSSSSSTRNKDSYQSISMPVHLFQFDPVCTRLDVRD